MNKENCALKLVDEIILYYDARSKKHQKDKLFSFPLFKERDVMTKCITTFITFLRTALFHVVRVYKTPKSLSYGTVRCRRRPNSKQQNILNPLTDFCTKSRNLSSTKPHGFIKMRKTGNVAWCNNEVRSCNHCRSGKAVIITYCECVFV